MANKEQKNKPVVKKQSTKKAPKTGSVSAQEARIRSKHSHKKNTTEVKGKTGNRGTKVVIPQKPKVINLQRSLDKARATRERNAALNVTKDGRANKGR